jgi:hypothetical protein
VKTPSSGRSDRRDDDDSRHRALASPGPIVLVAELRRRSGDQKLLAREVVVRAVGQLVLVVTIAQAVIGVAAQSGAEVVPRLALQKLGAPFESPRVWAMRVRVDSSTGTEVRYDPRPRVVPIDPAAGWYGLVWIGYDGREKIVRYQRPDAIDAVVRAEARVDSSGRYHYTYDVATLSTSRQMLGGFGVQTFGTDVTVISQPALHIGRLGARFFDRGTWFRFAPLTGYQPPVRLGGTSTFRLSASAPPGVVACSVDGGQVGYKGVGEEMPEELERLLPGYQAWPRGFTIGPFAGLTTMTAAQRGSQLAEWIPEFERLGWMTTTARRRYHAGLGRGGLTEIAAMLEADLGAGHITREVASIVRGMLPRR